MNWETFHVAVELLLTEADHTVEVDERLEKGHQPSSDGGPLLTTHWYNGVLKVRRVGIEPTT
jgi:hypothetical protein